MHLQDEILLVKTGFTVSGVISCTVPHFPGFWVYVGLGWVCGGLPLVNRTTITLLISNIERFGEGFQKWKDLVHFSADY